MMDLEKGEMYKLDLPFNISSLHPLSQDQYLVVAEPSQDPQQQVQWGVGLLLLDVEKNSMIR